MVLIEYIAGNTVTIAQANESENCIKIAKALRKAHAIRKNPYHGRPRNEMMEGFKLIFAKQETEGVSFSGDL